MTPASFIQATVLATAVATGVACGWALLTHPQCFKGMLSDETGKLSVPRILLLAATPLLAIAALRSGQSSSSLLEGDLPYLLAALGGTNALHLVAKSRFASFFKLERSAS